MSHLGLECQVDAVLCTVYTDVHTSYIPGYRQAVVGRHARYGWMCRRIPVFGNSTEGRATYSRRTFEHIKERYMLLFLGMYNRRVPRVFQKPLGYLGRYLSIRRYLDTRSVLRIQVARAPDAWHLGRCLPAGYTLACTTERPPLAWSTAARANPQPPVEGPSAQPPIGACAACTKYVHANMCYSIHMEQVLRVESLEWVQKCRLPAAVSRRQRVGREEGNRRGCSSSLIQLRYESIMVMRT